jgi:hypothetical protein
MNAKITSAVAEIQGSIETKYRNQVPYPIAPRRTPEYREGMQKYREGEQKRVSQFRADLEKAFGFEKHPKRNLLWDKAWEHGHGSGLHDVLYYYEEFAQFVL